MRATRARSTRSAPPCGARGLAMAGRLGMAGGGAPSPRSPRCGRIIWPPTKSESMTGKTYLRPTGFVDAPFGHDGKVARLAGGLQFFASVEIVGDAGAELVPVAGIEDRLHAPPAGG